MSKKNETSNNSKPMAYDALLGNVIDIFEADRDYTYYEEQMRVQSLFKSLYGFKCKMSLAHEIILEVRKQKNVNSYFVFEYFRNKRYGNMPAG